MNAKSQAILLLASLAFAVAPLYADTENVNGITWTYTISDGKASIGGGDMNSPAVSSGTAGSVSIPATLGNCPVTSIGAYAFYRCWNLSSITIPDGVTSIGISAFSRCSVLTSVTIPDGVTSIGTYAFSGCSKLSSITIPDSVTKIGSSAFSDCSGLTSIMIGNGLTSIGSGAFSGCSGLTSIAVDFGNSDFDSRNNCDAIIRTADNTLLAGCKNTLIPDGVTSIGDYAFSGCSGLTSITIPDSVTSIGNYAFSYCSGLTSLSLPGRFRGNTSSMGIPSGCTVTFRD